MIVYMLIVLIFGFVLGYLFSPYKEEIVGTRQYTKYSRNMYGKYSEREVKIVQFKRTYYSGRIEFYSKELKV